MGNIPPEHKQGYQTTGVKSYVVRSIYKRAEVHFIDVQLRKKEMILIMMFDQIV